MRFKSKSPSAATRIASRILAGLSRLVSLTAMVAGLAWWLLELLIDSQRARDSLWPENAACPCVLLHAMAMWGTSQQLLAFPDNPMLDLLPHLVDFFHQRGPLLSETLGAASEGDLSWNQPSAMPTAASLQRELEGIRADMAAAIPAVRTWRLSLNGPSGLSFDRRLFALLATLSELDYFDNFPILEVIAVGIKNIMDALNLAVANRGINLEAIQRTSRVSNEPTGTSQ